MVNKQYVYLITLDWATEDDKGFEFDICSTPKKAFEIFRKRIKAEKNAVHPKKRLRSFVNGLKQRKTRINPG